MNEREACYVIGRENWGNKLIYVRLDEIFKITEDRLMEIL